MDEKVFMKFVKPIQARYSISVNEDGDVVFHSQDFHSFPLKWIETIMKDGTTVTITHKYGALTAYRKVTHVSNCMFLK